MRISTVIIAICLASDVCVAQEADSPRELAGFLSPGTCVGIRPSRNTDAIKITIYSKEDFDIAVDSREMEMDALAEKYDKVKQTRDRLLANFAKSLNLKRDQLPPGTTYGEPTTQLTHDPNELLGKIVHAGEDYIMIASGDSLEKRQVFALRFISAIRWHDEFPWNTSVKHISTTPDRSKR